MFSGARRRLTRVALFASVLMLLSGCSHAELTPQDTSHQITAVATPVALPTYQPPKPPPPLPQYPSLPPLKSMPVLAGEAVIQRYKNQSQALTQTDWEGLGRYVCKDLAAGGMGLYTTKAAMSAPAEAQQGLMTFARDAAVTSYCLGTKKPPLPAGYPYSGFDDQILMAMRLDIDRQQSEMADLIVKYSNDVLDYGSRYNVDVTLLLLNARQGLNALTSSTVTCNDGWVSSSGGSQGACSHHGGIP